MTTLSRTRSARALAVAAAALTAVATTSAATAGARPAAQGRSAPALRLVTASSDVTLDRYPGDGGVYLDLGAYLVADGAPFEVHVTRKSYADPVTATQLIRKGATTARRALPAALVGSFSGFPRFLHVAVTDGSGRTVLDRDQDFCPGNPAGRINPDASPTSDYPEGCATNPFTLGSVWGIRSGWGAQASPGWDSAPVDLKDGTYTARISVNKAYRDFFGIPAGQRTVRLTVRTATGEGHGAAAARRAEVLAARPNAARPTGTAHAPRGVRPDLRPLPAWGIRVGTPDTGVGAAAAPARDYLQFSATVWNAGPSPLVVDGFRQAGKDRMDAYQYFYDAQGRQLGYAPTGTMQWDPRDGHEHWHFTDFAGYSLLDGAKKEVVRSQKEAFCLANTDAVDYTVKHADWKPSNTDLHTACGGHNALSVREVLDVGSGDTYVQYLPGQSFDVTGLPNGTYWIRVVANPAHRLYETDLRNNTSLRKVVLGGTPGARTVTVPPYQQVDEH